MASLIIPLLFSIFKLDFIKDWKNFGISTTFIAILFLIWDVIFTSSGIWGFNDDFCLGIYFLKIPLEEWLFFFIIPFCSLFTHFAFFYALPNIKLPKGLTLIISLCLIILSVVLIYSNLQKSYTVVNFSFLLITIVLGTIYRLKLLQQFYISFLIILIPFIIVNGILTGAVTEAPIVWYNDLENLGIRLYTIPIEDVGYAFSMLFGNLLIFKILKD
jgi:lycopene cyclase domain-containing protein